MNSLNYINNKLKLIYASKTTYIMIALQLVFLVGYMEVSEISSPLEFISILEIDYYLWIIYIPILVVMHKVSIFSTYYNCLSRIHSKHKQMIVDYAVLALSSFVVSVAVIFLPLAIMKLAHNADFTDEIIVNIMFLVIRYNVLGLFVQYVVYTLIFKFPILQRYSNVIYVMPILLYFIFTIPLEWLTANSSYVSALDFSAGRHYLFILEDNTVLWDACLFFNIHLIGYLVVYTWFSLDFLSKKMEYLENEDNNT